MDESDDDQRETEMESLSAIFPEIELDEQNPYKFSLEIPVHPSQPVVVYFPAPGTAPVTAPVTAPAADLAVENPGNQIDSHALSHLPAVRLEVCLPKGYPEQVPPDVTLSTSPPWLPSEVRAKLVDDATRLWEMGRDIVVFTYADHVRQEAETVFGLVGEQGSLQVDAQHKIAILDYDIQATRAAFERETFECGVCLDPKKGAVCHRMLDCGHVFCVQCLQDFYNNAITEGDLASVRCLEPTCPKEREVVVGKKRRKVKNFVSPSELLQIPLEQDVVTRYVKLKYKTELESDKNTIYCPRSWCTGAARSKRHKKPEGFEIAQVSEDSESDEEHVASGKTGEAKKASKPSKVPKMADLLAVCEDCSFAFCSRCYQSWHGEFYRCTPRRDTEELTAEEQASLEYMKLHTTPCPTCAAPAQKTHGCNHMICYRCQTHFCYLCSAWLDPSNPYQHYNELPGGRVTGCYMRLWELEGGDGDNVGYGFGGGERPGDGAPGEAAPPVLEQEDLALEQLLDDVDLEDDAAGAANGGIQGNAEAQREAVAREGPLVLRIAAMPPPRREQALPPAVPAPPAPRPRNRGQGANQAQPPRGGRRAGARGAAGPGQLAAGPGRGDGHRQNQNQNQQINQRHQDVHEARNGQGAAAGRRGGGAGQARGDQGANMPPGGVGAEELNEAQQAWVRHFVQLALIDNEDLVDWDDGDEDW